MNDENNKFDFNIDEVVNNHVCCDSEILICESDKFMENIYKMCIKKFSDGKIKVSYTENGKECVSKILTKEICQNCKQFKLLFLSTLTQELSGYEIVNILHKELLDSNYLNIVIPTASEVEEVKESMGNGVKIIKEIVSKPLKAKTINEMLKKYLI